MARKSGFESAKRSASRFWKNNKKYLLTGIFICLLAFGGLIRLYNLGGESFWIDESMSALAAKKIHQHGIPIFDSGVFYSRALGFHYIMSGFLLLGYNEFNARLASVIFGLLTCILAFFIAREHSKTAGWMAMILALFMEIFVVYSRQARMYQLEMLLFFLSLFLLYRYLEKEKNKYHFKKEENKYRLEKKENKCLFLAALVFIIALDTNTIALLLVPFFAYAFWKRKPWLLYPLGILAVFFIIRYRLLTLILELSQKNIIYHIILYGRHLAYYAPFIAISGIGLILVWKKKITKYLAVSLLLIFAAGALYRTFAFRYVYAAFLPLAVLASFTFSSIKLRWPIFIGYLLITSNILAPIAYTTILLPESRISNVDFTQPEADFRGLYRELENHYSNETLIVAFTPAAEWYFKKPDYWIRFSFTGLNETGFVRNSREVYTGAAVIWDADGFISAAGRGDSIAVVGDWGAMKIAASSDSRIVELLKNECTEIIRKEKIYAFRCSNLAGRKSGTAEKDYTGYFMQTSGAEESCFE